MFIVTPYTRKLRDFNGTKQTLGFIEIPWFPPTEFMCVVCTVGSPTAPEVHHTRTILFAAEVRMRECAVKGIFCLLYIHSDFSLHST